MEITQQKCFGKYKTCQLCDSDFTSNPILRVGFKVIDKRKPGCFSIQGGHFYNLHHWNRENNRR